MTLQSQIEQLITQMTDDILERIRSMPLSELLDARASNPAPAPPTKARPTNGHRRKRTSAPDVAEHKVEVLAAIKSIKAKNGIAKSDVAAKVQVKKNPAYLTRILQLLVEDGSLRKTGDRRLTRYFVK
jgi:hypothetical protein